MAVPGGPYAAGKEQGLPLWKVPPRPPFCSSWPSGRLWAFKENDPAQVTECGHAVVEALVPAVVSMLRQLLDRQMLIEEVRRADVLPLPGPDSSPLNLFGGGQGREVLPLLADAGDTATVAGLMRVGHVSSLIASRQGNPFATSLIRWATARLASRGAPNLEEFLEPPV